MMMILVPEFNQSSFPNHSPPKIPRKPTTGATNPLSLLSKCTSLKEIMQIQAYCIKTHIHNNMFLVTKVINQCTIEPTASSMYHAHQMFDQIPHPDIILFNFMARGYSRSYTPLQAVLLFVRAVSFGLVPDHYTFPSLFKACANAKALEEGYVRSNQPKDAMLMFREMQIRSLKPTDVTMLSVLSACALLGALDTGKWVHEYIKANGFDKYVKVNTTLIDMYSKCGSLENAVSVFNNMPFKDTQTWSTMIMAYAIHGYGHKAISLFKMMIIEQVQPDEITLLSLLYACNHSGLVNECLTYFHNMREKFGISPGIKHYGCVLDALGRSGRLEDAYKFIQEIPTKPTPILWRTLLASCSSHGNLELGRRVLARIFEMDQSHGGDYVIFSNLCARAGKQEDVIHTRKLMKDRGVVKTPGCSTIEIKNQVHEFFSGDGTRVDHQELQRAVDKLFEKLKLVGYEPDISLVVHLDMKDADKEVSLRYHSEKLAITFGLLNTRPGETIRVTKNLRICSDCHSACKLLSLVSGREIFVRDMHRFHHFARGKCACADYW